MIIISMHAHKTLNIDRYLKTYRNISRHVGLGRTLNTNRYHKILIFVSRHLHKTLNIDRYHTTFIIALNSYTEQRYHKVFITISLDI